MAPAKCYKTRLGPYITLFFFSGGDSSVRDVSQGEVLMGLRKFDDQEGGYFRRRTRCCSICFVESFNQLLAVSEVPGGDSTVVVGGVLFSRYTILEGTPNFVGGHNLFYLILRDALHHDRVRILRQGPTEE